MSSVARGIMGRVARETCIDHHDAFLVQLFGEEASNLGDQRIQELIDAGIIEPWEVNKVLVPGAGCDYLEFLMHVNHHIGMHHEDLDKIQEMRNWGLDQWTGIVADRVNDLKDQPIQEPQFVGGSVEIKLPGAMPKPLPPISTQNTLKPDIPEGVRDYEIYGYQQAVTRAGEFARGLGQEMGADLEHMVMEEWHDETIVSEVDADKRAEQLDIIREETAREMVEAKDARALARRLAEKTGDYAHNWERIARTELQAAYNDARVIAGVEDYGSNTQIARIHEGNACEDCIRLFGPSQNPVVFSVQELFENGTNVGKRRRDWAPTIFPLHPNCRCDTVIVPPGFTIEDGKMVRKQE